jgi:TonB family protein
METLISYLLKSSIWLTAFGLVYQLFLRNERFFVLNRLFLLAGALSAILLPLITVRYVVIVPLENETVSTELLIPGTIQQIKEPLFTWETIVAGIILSGAIFFSLRLLFQTLKVIKTIRSSEVKIENNLKVIKTNIFPFSFSFFAYIVVNPSLQGKEIREIVAHEAAHVRQHHWIDLVLAELLRTVQWYNPMSWLYAHYIKQNHEYLADRSALKSSSDPAVYKAILINQLLGGEVIRLGHSFSYSLNKKRFIMMKDTSTSITRKIKPLLVLPLMAIIFYAFSEARYQPGPSLKEDANTFSAKSEAQGKKINGIILQENGEPLPGTSIIIMGSTTGAVADSKGKFSIKDVPENSQIAFSFVGFKTIKKEADFNKKMVILMKKDIIQKDPEITIRGSEKKDKKENPLVLLDGKEIPFSSMNDISPEGIESIDVLKNESVTKKYGEKGKNGVILITSKKAEGLSAKDKSQATDLQADKKENRKSQKNYNGKPVFFIVEEMPKFPGGEEALKAFIEKNLQYPEEAKQKGIEGKVLISFIITPEGKTAQAKIARGVDPSLDAEAIRVIKALPTWTPGKQRGKNVAVNYTMPINFKL